MGPHEPAYLKQLSHFVGWSLLATIVMGIASAMTLSADININLSADIVQTSQNMLNAAERIRGKAYLALLFFMLDCFIGIGLYLILRANGHALATWSLLLGVSASILALLGAVYAMNIAMIAENNAFELVSNQEQRLMLTSLLVTSDYTSFHLSIILSSAAKAGFFFLFWKSRLIPRLLSAWGVFASLFLVSMIVGRDFIALLANDLITAAFMGANMLALVALALYLAFRGVRASQRIGSNKVSLY